MADVKKSMEHAQEMAANEIDKLYRKGDMTEAGLKALGELMDVSKDASIVIAMCEEKEGHSYGRMPYMYGYGYDDYSMARRRDGDGDGRYNEGRSRSYGYNAYGGSYNSYAEGKNEAIQKLERKMQEARDDRERETYRSMIRELEN